MEKFGVKPLNPYFNGQDENPEFEVQHLLSQFGWDGNVPVDLKYICEMYDYQLTFESHPDRPEIGWSRISEFGSHIVVNTARTFPEDDFSEDDMKRRRQRFTLAHEIAHCTFKTHKDTQMQRNLKDKNNPHSYYYNTMREVQADEFAACLLLPTDHFTKFLNTRSFSNMKKLMDEICETYDVSFMTALLRIPRCCNHSCISILFNKNGNVIRVPIRSKSCEDDGLYIGKDDPIPKETVADSLLRGKTYPYTKKEFRDCQTWFPTFRGDPAQYKVVEHTFNLGDYGIATFLEAEFIE